MSEEGKANEQGQIDEILQRVNEIQGNFLVELTLLDTMREFRKASAELTSCGQKVGYAARRVLEIAEGAGLDIDRIIDEKQAEAVRTMAEYAPGGQGWGR